MKKKMVRPYKRLKNNPEPAKKNPFHRYTVVISGVQTYHVILSHAIAPEGIQNINTTHEKNLYISHLLIYFSCIYIFSSCMATFFFLLCIDL